MKHPVIPIAVQVKGAVQGSSQQRKREAPKGRRVDATALTQVQSLLGDELRRRDLLIEHLHKIQDRFGHLSAAHLAALAQEMRLAQTEVYEVASFYHHFDVVKEGQEAPAALTVRVCDGLSCEMAGARDLLERLPAMLGAEVRVLAAPCIGRCEQAPAVVVGQHPVPRASCEDVVAAVQAKAVLDTADASIGLSAYRAGGGYATLQACSAGKRDVEAVIATLEASGLRGLGGAGFPAAVRAPSRPGAHRRLFWPSEHHRGGVGPLAVSWRTAALAPVGPGLRGGGAGFGGCAGGG